MNGFDFTTAVAAVCRDMTRRVPELGHIDMDRVAVGFCQARKRGKYGVQATLTPMRFERGAETKRVRGRTYGCSRLFDAQGREQLYLLNFYLPRFQDGPLEEKLTTVVHELWHISAEFDGDLRRHAGRCYAHGSSQKKFDEHAARLAREWLAADPPPGLWAFLELSFDDLVAEHGTVRGARYRAPKLVRLDAA
ncbi:hypothetical protein Mal64_15680 [Pseudobythopirellula maris]|uniref:Phage metallopeptidase domain-containing protein n=1 Tax=Pseudobythopirellula maris TaxID=2527991 RepID=A0A5C5ZLY5_9BACT|nr:putative metallopeptidase [Pseudobythopirellula maris]TWT88096.1 hypothetical protein Mal64_15680 [Pseudobythopirellula maris]